MVNQEQVTSYLYTNRDQLRLTANVTYPYDLYACWEQPVSNHIVFADEIIRHLRHTVAVFPALSILAKWY
jgi:hypothetical protein